MVAIKVLAKELSVCLLTSWSDDIYCPAADGCTLGRKTQPPGSTEFCPAANTPPCMHKQMGISRRPRHLLHSAIDVALNKFCSGRFAVPFSDLISHVLESY